MLNTLIASAALFGASVSALGSAVVLNSCSYPVYLSDVPAAGGGGIITSKTLSTGETWSQVWTELSNDDGWSIKLSKTQELDSILQYEFTYHTYTPDIIWLDLSDVNGSPWPNGTWHLSSDNADCDLVQRSYEYATDDAWAMQACPSDASVTVELCYDPSSASSGGESATPAPEAVPAPTPAESTTSVDQPAPVPTTTSVVAAPATTTADPVPTVKVPFVGGGGLVEDNVKHHKSADAAPSPTTFATAVSLAPLPAGVAEATVTQIDTAIVTAVVTAIAPGRLRRHEHHARHHHA